MVRRTAAGHARGVDRSHPSLATSRLPWHGAGATACWFIHGAYHLHRGTAHDLLWACNVAVPLLAIGCFLGRRLPCAIAILWLSFGTPIWLLDLATGAGLIVTSPLVHVAAPIIGVSALRALGWPKRAWPFATGASLVLLAVSRAVGSAGPNVNLAFRVHQGWEAYFRSHTLFLAALLAASGLLFFLVDVLVLTYASRRARQGPGVRR